MALRKAFAGLVCLFAAAACAGQELPARLPSTESYERAACRVELVELVIIDPERAAKVRALYIEIEVAMLAAKAAQVAAVAELGARPEGRTEAQARALFDGVRIAEMQALERQTGLQLEIRALTTAAEFARLDAIK